MTGWCRWTARQTDGPGPRGRRRRHPGPGGLHGAHRRRHRRRSRARARAHPRPHPRAGRHLADRDGRRRRSVGYVRLAQFTRGSAEALRDAITALRDKKATALVLDLRGDPGGLVTEAVGVTGAFLPDGAEVVVTRGAPLTAPGLPHRLVPGRRRPAPWWCWWTAAAPAPARSSPGPCATPIGPSLVGERTFGKALVQSTVLLRDGGALKLTTARYLTPSGYDLAKRGLPPDVKVADDPATPRRRGPPAGPRARGGRMSRGGPAAVLVAELVSSGRGAAAQPAFEPGLRIPLAKGARGGAVVGDLVTVTLRGRAARVTAVHGSASSPTAALRALLVSEDLARPFPRAVLEEAEALDEGDVGARPRPPRPARPARHHDRSRTAPRTTTTPSPSPTRAAGRRASGCTSPTSRGSSRRAARSTARPPAAVARSTCRAW